MFLSSAPSSLGNWASLASKPLSMRTWPDLCLTPGLWTRTRRGRFAVSTGESAPPSSSRQTARLYLIRPASHRRRGAGHGSRRERGSRGRPGRGVRPLPPAAGSGEHQGGARCGERRSVSRLSLRHAARWPKQGPEDDRPGSRPRQRQRDAVRQGRSHPAGGSAANGARNARWPRARPDARSGRANRTDARTGSRSRKVRGRAGSDDDAFARRRLTRREGERRRVLRPRRYCPVSSAGRLHAVSSAGRCQSPVSRRLLLPAATSPGRGRRRPPGGSPVPRRR